MVDKQLYTRSILIAGCLLFSNVISMPSRKRSSLSENESEQTIFEGETINITCGDRESTSPVFHWLHNGVIYEQGPHDLIASNIISPPPTLHRTVFTEATTNTSLIIRNANQHHSGKYTCVSDTAEKRRTESFIVNVIPKEAHKSTATEENVRIYQKTTELYQDEGDNAHLICRATQGLTKSAPLIRWTLNGEVLDASDHNYELYPNGDLRINRLSYQEHDGKVLTCTAFGEHGMDSYSPFVFVFERSP